jgi:hypothetical protein
MPWALWAVCAGIAIIAGSGLLQSVLLTRLFETMRHAGPEFDFDAWVEDIQFYYRIFPLMLMAGYAVLAYAVTRLGRAPALRGARVLGWIAFVAFALTALDNVLLAASNLGKGQSALAEFINAKAFAVAGVSLYGLAMACLLLLLAKLSRAVGRPLHGGLRPLAWLWIAWEVGFPLFMILFEPTFELRRESPWAYFALTRSMWLVGLALFAIITVRLARALERPAEHLEAGRPELPNMGALNDTATRPWSAVAAGLELYASALSWRIFLTIGGYFFLFFAVISRSAGISKLLTFGMPLIALITSIAMLVGLARYARQPETSPAGGAAWLSVVLMGVGLVMDLYGFFLALRLLAPEGASYSELRATAESAQSLSTVAMGVGFGSLLALLVSFAQLARHMSQSKLEDRIFGTGAFFAVVASMVIGFRWYVANAHTDAGMLLAIGFAVLIGALIAIVAYLNLVNTTVRAIRENQADVDLPPARVV